MHISKELVELRNEVAKFRNETKQRLDLIEHELGKHISLNYVGTMVDYMARTTTDFIKALDCPENREEEVNCKEEFVGRQQTYITGMKMGKLSEANKALVVAIEIAKKEKNEMIAKRKETCAACYQRLMKVLDANKSLLEEIQMLNAPPKNEEQRLTVINNINPSELEEEILAPISHRARLQIMLSTFNGNGRFANLAESTNLDGGHLLYHINKLTQYGFIQKHSSGDYRLTKKGIRTLLFLAQLDKEK